MKFTFRVFIVLSIAVAPIGYIIGYALPGYHDSDAAAAQISLLAIIAVWGSYFAIKWILKALPANND